MTIASALQNDSHSMQPDSRLRLEILTQDDPLYIFPFFDEFLRNYRHEFSIARVSSSPAMGKRSRVQMIKELTSLYGNLGFTRLAIERVISNLLGKLPASKTARKFHTLSQLCRAFGVQYQNIGNPNSAGFVADLQQSAPDVIVSVACPYILKEAILGIPKFGCINIHHAPLPRYKGMMPTFWQMYHGEKTVGVTVHSMERKVDEGQTFLQESLEVHSGEPLDTLIRRSKRHGAHCMARVLRQIATGTHKPLPASSVEPSYFTFPTGEEIREFQRRGYRAI